ncbi:hypothetical protein K523DRAFT_358985 [Schizophyllum commune Tattone D]|nr:hypothetical protein K523DRAFT_358985 [Schizophyllum commune Tattone D]
MRPTTSLSPPGFQCTPSLAIPQNKVWQSFFISNLTSSGSARTAAATPREALPALFAGVAVLAREAAHQQLRSAHQFRRRREVRASRVACIGNPRPAR